jgi:heat shock protein HslJ
MRYLLATLILWCCMDNYAAEYLKVIYIADYRTDCDTGKCLLSRSSPEDEWQSLNYSIKGFDFKEGIEYCLLVNVQTNDSTGVTGYELSEIKSKRYKAVQDTNADKLNAIPDSSKWWLYKLKTKDGIKTFTLQKTQLQFDVKQNTVSGNTDCNTFTCGYQAFDNQLSFDNITTSKITCRKNSIEPEFLKALQSATHYKISSKMLYLYKGKSLLALFTAKK